MRERMAEFAGRVREQLGCGGQIPVGGSRVAVTEIGRQRREPGFDVVAGPIPAGQHGDSERMSKIMNPRRVVGSGADGGGVAQVAEHLLHDGVDQRGCRGSR